MSVYYFYPDFIYIPDTATSKIRECFIIAQFRRKKHDTFQTHIYEGNSLSKVPFSVTPEEMSLPSYARS